MIVAILLCVAGLIVGGVVAGLVAFKAGSLTGKKEPRWHRFGGGRSGADPQGCGAAGGFQKERGLLEAKDEIHRLRSEAERELKDRRSDVQRQERRVQQKEETLDRKIENYEKKEEAIGQKQKDIEARLEDVENLKKGQFEMLERISRLHQGAGEGVSAQQPDGRADA